MGISTIDRLVVVVIDGGVDVALVAQELHRTPATQSKEITCVAQCS